MSISCRKDAHILAKTVQNNMPKLARKPLPLAYMRITILTCNKYDNLHRWICDVLLPKLIEGKVYNVSRQWQGWINCANFLENTGGANISSLARAAVEKLPEEQKHMYKAEVKRIRAKRSFA